MESGGGRVTGSSLHAQCTMLQWIVGQVNNAATQKKITINMVKELCKIYISLIYGVTILLWLLMRFKNL